MNIILDESLAAEKLQEMAYGKFWIRILAFLLDYLLLVAIYLIFYLLLSFDPRYSVYLDASIFLLRLYLQIRYGATIGKMITNLKIVNSEFEQAGIGSILLRDSVGIFFNILMISLFVFNISPSFLYYSTQLNIFFPEWLNTYFANSWITCLTIIVLIADGLVFVFSQKHQALHDIIAATYVVRKMKEKAER